MAALSVGAACSDETTGGGGTGAIGGTSGIGGAAGMGGAGGMSGGGGTGNVGVRCEEDITVPPPCDAPGQLLRNAATCANAACHDERARGAMLDLKSPCVARRLLGVPTSSADPCAGRILVDPANPLTSVFVDKLNQTPACGVRMPNTGAVLSPDQVTCITNWITWLVQNQQ